MTSKLIRPSLVSELESFHAPGQLLTSHYLDLKTSSRGELEEAHRDLKNTLARERKRIDQLAAPRGERQSLLRDLEIVDGMAQNVLGERSTLGLACFVASERGLSDALQLRLPIRARVFFEDRFVIWPLQQILDQCDHYAIALTDKDEARIFLFCQGWIEEVSDIFDEIPGRVRFPDPFRELEYMRKRIEQVHQHFDRVSEAALRVLRREPFERLIIGGLWETLPQFESRLHRYLRDRIVARWDIDVHTPTEQILERARQEEHQILDRQARAIWREIQDNRPLRGAIGPDDVLAAVWQRRVQTLLETPGALRQGFRCATCDRLQLIAGPCVECGGLKLENADVYEEAVHEAIEQVPGAILG